MLCELRVLLKGGTGLQTIGERIKHLREVRGLTQQDLAALTGLQRGNISHYERNKVKPSAEAIVQLATFFNVSSDWLLTGREQIKGENGDLRVAERLRQLRRQRGLTVEEFAQQSGVSAEEAAGWEAGRLLPSAAVLAKLTVAFGISLDWLITGEEAREKAALLDPGLDETGQEDLQLITEFLHYRRQRANLDRPGHPDSTGDKPVRPCELVREEGMSYLPLFGNASVSPPLLPDVVLEGFVAVESRYAKDGSFVVRVSDADSRATGMEPGDLAVVQYQREAAPGEVALVRMGEGTAIRRVLAGQEPIRSRAVDDGDDPDPGGFAGEVQVIGRVAHVVKPGDWRWLDQDKGQ